MRQVDDAHDAEHEIQPEPDQGEIEAEQHAGEEAVELSIAARSAAGPACPGPDRWSPGRG